MIDKVMAGWWKGQYELYKDVIVPSWQRLVEDWKKSYEEIRKEREEAWREIDRLREEISNLKKKENEVPDFRVD